MLFIGVQERKRKKTLCRIVTARSKLLALLGMTRRTVETCIRDDGVVGGRVSFDRTILPIISIIAITSTGTTGASKVLRKHKTEVTKTLRRAGRIENRKLFVRKQNKRLCKHRMCTRAAVV